MGVDRSEIMSTDGARSQALVQATTGRSAGVVVGVPALGTSAGYYEPFVLALAARGYDVVFTENRGTGTSDQRPGRGLDFGYHVAVSRDLPAAMSAARRLFPDRRVTVLGHSLGGHLAAMFAATRPAEMARLALVAAGSVHFRAYSGLSLVRVLGGTQLAAAIATVLGFYPGDRLGFGGRQPRSIIQDWARFARTGALRPAGADVDYQAALGELRMPVFVLSLEGDSLAPPNAVEALAEMLPRAAKTRVHVSLGASAGGEPHFRWARKPDAVVDALDPFLRGEG